MRFRSIFEDSAPRTGRRSRSIRRTASKHSLLETLAFAYAATVVIGPVASVRDRLALAEREGNRIDAAVLDVNLRNERVFAVADALISRGIPIVFCTGYEPLLLGKPYVNAPCITKPIDPGRLAKTLSAAIAAAPPAEHREPR